jgi:hypothetical protein
VENTPKPPDKQQKPREQGKKPPGQFLTSELEEQTARFLRELKSRAKQREDAKSEESKGPPPPRPPDDQLSSRR